MFTGIIEALGRIISIEESGTNRSFRIESAISDQLRVDQSVAHNGVCLTVEVVQNRIHQVTAVEETLKKTDLSEWKVGALVNLERCLQLNSRLDGHFVQGHVDCTGICDNILEQEGSWIFTFTYPGEFAHLIVEKGSITVNGTSLTAFNVIGNQFSIAIIPYTFENTNIRSLKPGSAVNLEFDLIGKHIARIIETKGMKT